MLKLKLRRFRSSKLLYRASLYLILLVRLKLWLTMALSPREEAIGPKEAFRNLTLLPVIVVSLVLSYVAVGLRLWTRGYMKKILGWDDFCIVIAQVMLKHVNFSTSKLMDQDLIYCVLWSTTQNIRPCRLCIRSIFGQTSL